MRYCQRCVLPDTRPGLVLDESGTCNACRAHGRKREIDWDRRRDDLEAIFARTRQRDRGYDCLIPVSGGKDSTWQVVVCREYGLRILAVTWRTPARTAIGRQNLENLIGLGVDHIDFTIHPDVERRFHRRSFVKTGSAAVPMHMAIYAIPLRVALNFGIPLVIWGENPYLEYGGSEQDAESDRWDHDPLLRHGILQGTTAADWVDEELSAKDLEPYFLPPEDAYRAAGVHSLLLGYYLKWDPDESRRVATAHGFRADTAGPRVGLYDYADIDCHFISVHHHFKWVKFGFTRLWDNLALEIRNGRLTRDEAIRHIAERGDQTPHADIERFCAYTGLSRAEFRNVEERCRNRDIWERCGDRWVIRDFLIRDWNWQ